MEVKKGSLVHVDGWWFVVVCQHGDRLCCICDNATNVYSWKIEDCKEILTPYEAMRLHGWGDIFRENDEDCGDRLNDLKRERSIPTDVIAEVLAGCHDDRFNHTDAEHAAGSRVTARR